MDNLIQLECKLPYRPWSNEWMDDCETWAQEVVYLVLERRAARRRVQQQLLQAQEQASKPRSSGPDVV